MKVKDNALFFGATKLYNKTSNQHITLVGVMHLGPQGYLDSIVRYCKHYKQKGWLLTSEGVSEEDFLNRAEKNVQDIEVFRKVNRATRPILTSMKFDVQSDIFSDRLPDLVFLESDSFGYWKIAYSIIKECTLSQMRKRMRVFKARYVSALRFFLADYKKIGKKNIKRRRTIPDYFLFDREHFAVEKLKQLLDQGNSNIVSIWGDAHISGLVRLLKGEGFVVVGTEWLPAFHFPR
jgi:hypothetical protein